MSSSVYDEALKTLPPSKQMLRWWGYNMPIFKSRVGHYLYIHAAAIYNDYIVINDGRDWYPLYKNDASEDTIGILKLIIEKHGQANTSPKY